MLLDYKALQLKLLPGATVLMMEVNLIADPFRRPSALLATVLHQWDL
jgi:hypothetical protein